MSGADRFGCGYSPAMLARIFRSLLLLMLVTTLSGCASGPSANFEAFSRNRLAVLARNLESTRDAQKIATDQLVAAVDVIKKETGEGADPAKAYEVARRTLATSESRVRAAHNR